MVRELFEMARSKKACIIFFDEVDAIGGARFDDGAGGDNEVQRTMLELINQLDGFDPRGNIKVLMATNRPDTLDPALLRPGRLDRRVEFSLPDNEGRAHILRIHARRSVGVSSRHSTELTFSTQYERRAEHPVRPHRTTLSKYHRCRVEVSGHRSWYVRHPSKAEGCDRARFPGRGGEGRTARYQVFQHVRSLSHDFLLIG